MYILDHIHAKEKTEQSLYRPDRPWGYQQVEAPRFQDNRHMKMVRLLALRTGHLLPSKEIFLVLISVIGTTKIINRILYIYIYIYIYTECPEGNVSDFGRMYRTLKYTDITQNTYIRSWTSTEIMAREKCGLLVVPRTVPVSHIVTRTLRMSVL